MQSGQTNSRLRIREVRLARGMSQERLGELVGVTHQAIQRYENGDIDICLSRIQAIAAALGATVHDLACPRQGAAPVPAERASQKVSAEEKALLRAWRSIKNRKKRRAALEIIRQLSNR